MEVKSIYKQFYIKLIFATSILISALSFIYYQYTKSNIYENIQKDMLDNAKEIFVKFSSNKNDFKSKKTHNTIIRVIKKENLKKYKFYTIEHHDRYFIKLLYPFDKKLNKFIEITRNINTENEFLYRIIFKNLFILGLLVILLMLIYSLVLSKSLLKPVLQINDKLSHMDENSLTKIEKKDLPIEFHSLAESINSLTNRIETYVKFKRELFIGAAHELKTPLAVMKLKNEVTLKKQRETIQYEDTLKLTIKQIDDMNKMISSILDIGRAEGAQFEQLCEINLVEYMKKKTNDYKMLSSQKNIEIDFHANVNYLKTHIQKTLFDQIIQNFVQNAIKFTAENKVIKINLTVKKKNIIITVTDGGIGIDEKMDLFAPFKRFGNQSGVGLGLFLAKNAADALGAKISLKNRIDGKKGCVAKLTLNNTSK